MKNRIRKSIKLITIFCILLSVIIAYSNVLVSWAAADSELTITPKPETNNMHLKWTGPLNSTYRVFQKKNLEVTILKRLDLQTLVQRQ